MILKSWLMTMRHKGMSENCVPYAYILKSFCMECCFFYILIYSCYIIDGEKNKQMTTDLKNHSCLFLTVTLREKEVLQMKSQRVSSKGMAVSCHNYS